MEVEPHPKASLVDGEARPEPRAEHGDHPGVAVGEPHAAVGLGPLTRVEGGAGDEEVPVRQLADALAARSKAEALGKSLNLKGPPGPRLQAVLEGAGFLNPAQPAARFWTDHS